MNAGLHCRCGHILPHKIQPPFQQVTVLLAPPLLYVLPSQVRIVSPCKVTTPIVDVSNVWVMGATAIFTGIHYKDSVFFAGVQGFVRAVLAILINVTADYGCDVGTAFEALLMQSIKDFFGVREIFLAIRECAIVILQIAYAINLN